MIQGPSPKGQGPCSIRLQFMENIQTRFLDMKLFKFSVAALLALATAFLGGCSDDDGIDNRDPITDTFSSNYTRRRPTTP